jgi:hypothetical protein
MLCSLATRASWPQRAEGWACTHPPPPRPRAPPPASRTLALVPPQRPRPGWTARTRGAERRRRRREEATGGGAVAAVPRGKRSGGSHRCERRYQPLVISLAPSRVSASSSRQQLGYYTTSQGLHRIHMRAVFALVPFALALSRANALTLGVSRFKGARCGLGAAVLG